MCAKEDEAEGMDALKKKLENQRRDFADIEAGLEETLASLEGSDHSRLKKIYEEEFKRRTEEMRAKLINEAVQFVRSKQKEITAAAEARYSKDMQGDQSQTLAEAESRSRQMLEDMTIAHGKALAEEQARHAQDMEALQTSHAAALAAEVEKARDAVRTQLREQVKDEVREELKGKIQDELASRLQSLKTEWEARFAAKYQAELEDLRTRLASEEARRAELEKARAQLQDQFEKSAKAKKGPKDDRLKKEAEEAAARARELEEGLATARSERDGMRGDLVVMRQEMDRLQNQLERVRSSRAQEEERSRTAQEDIESKLRGERARLEAEFAARLEELKGDIRRESQTLMEKELSLKLAGEKKALEEALRSEFGERLKSAKSAPAVPLPGTYMTMEEHKRILQEELDSARRNAEAAGPERRREPARVPAEPEEAPDVRMDARDLKKAVRDEIRALEKRGYTVARLESSLNEDVQRASRELESYKQGIEHMKVLREILDEKDYSKTGRNVERIKSLFNDPANIPRIEQEIAELELASDKVGEEQEELKRDLAALKSRGYNVSTMEAMLERDPSRGVLEFSKFLEIVDELQTARESLDAVSDSELAKEAQSLAKLTYDPANIEKVRAGFEKLKQAKKALDREQERKTKVSKLLIMAQKSMSDGDFKNAQTILGKYLSEYPDDRDAKELFDRAVEADIKVEESLAAARRPVSQNEGPAERIGGSAEELEALGNDAWSRKQYNKALEYFDMALKANPRYAPAWNNKGVVYRSLKKHKEAVEAYKKAIKLDPHFKNAYFNMGYAYLEMTERGSLERAIECFNKAIDIDPNYREARLLRDKSMEKLKKKNVLAYELLKRQEK